LTDFKSTVERFSLPATPLNNDAMACGVVPAKATHLP